MSASAIMFAAGTSAIEGVPPAFSPPDDTPDGRIWHEADQTGPEMVLSGSNVIDWGRLDGNFVQSSQVSDPARFTRQVHADGRLELTCDGLGDFMVTPNVNLSNYTAYVVHRSAGIATHAVFEHSPDVSDSRSFLFNVDSAPDFAQVRYSRSGTNWVKKTTGSGWLGGSGDWFASSVRFTGPIADAGLQQNGLELALSVISGGDVPAGSADEPVYLASRNGTDRFMLGAFRVFGIFNSIHDDSTVAAVNAYNFNKWVAV